METENGEKKLEEINILLKKLNPKAKVIIPSEDKYGDLNVTETMINTGLSGIYCLERGIAKGRTYS